MYTQSYYTSFEQFADEIAQWKVNFKQLSNEPFQASLQQLHSEQILLSSACFSNKLEQRGESPEGYITFAFVKPNSPKFIWRGKTAFNHIVIYRSGTEIDAFTQQNFDVLTLSILPDEIEEFAKMYGVKNDKMLLSQNEVIEVQQQSRIKLTQLAEKMLARGHQSDCFKEEQEDLIAELFCAIWHESNCLEKVPNTKKYNTFRKLTSYIEDNLTNKITLMDLCRKENISPRTVQRLFESFANIPPKQYIQARKLNRVRKELLNLSQEKSKISDIINNLGFWHLGQFAKDYKKLFLELPSETVRISRLKQ